MPLTLLRCRFAVHFNIQDSIFNIQHSSLSPGEIGIVSRRLPSGVRLDICRAIPPQPPNLLGGHGEPAGGAQEHEDGPARLLVCDLAEAAKWGAIVPATFRL